MDIEILERREERWVFREEPKVYGGVQFSERGWEEGERGEVFRQEGKMNIVRYTPLILTQPRLGGLVLKN